MKIHVSNRKEVSDLIHTLSITRASESICVISITDPEEPQATIECNERNILRQQFHDLDRVYSQLTEVTYFSPWHAIAIVNFLRHNFNRDHIIIHCEAGISRSPAIAAAICHHLRLPNAWELFRGPYMPNLMVFTILRSELGWK